MNSINQSGHALSTTLIVIILFSAFSLSITKNSLVDSQIAHAFSQQRLQEEHHLSAVSYLERNLLPRVIHSDSHLFELFRALRNTDQLQVSIPIATHLNLGESNSNRIIIEDNQYLDSEASITRVTRTSHDPSTPELVSKIHVEILDPNSGQKIIASYQYNTVDDTDAGVPESIRRLSFRKISVRSDANLQI